MSDQELATRGQRLAAVVIDGLIAGIVTIILMMVLLPIMGTDTETMATSFTSTIIATALNIGIFLLINGKFLAANGQTVGKKLMGIKIVSLSGGILPLKDVMLRRYAPPVLISIIPIIGGLFCLADVLCIFRGDRRCIHDMIAGTRVVRA
jgi:uncharacterized RDD family membrane protein YckC